MTDNRQSDKYERLRNTEKMQDYLSKAIYCMECLAERVGLVVK